MVIKELNYQQRINILRETKIKQNMEKQEVTGSLDQDDLAIILPPPDRREIVESVSGSGVNIKDAILNGINLKSNHPNGSFYGPKACGENLRILLENHPVYIDPVSSLAGRYMVNFLSYRKKGWKPEFDYSHLKPEHKKYNLTYGIGAAQHFCQDNSIGLKLGWKGILEKIRHYRKLNSPDKADFYDGEENVVFGIQNWISRHAETARDMAKKEKNRQLQENLGTIADMNERLVTEPPHTFREACQWMTWYQMVARLYNGSGSLGSLDVLLAPYYEQDIKEGILTDEEAIFHLACFLIKDTGYLQLGGYDKNGKDLTNKVSYLILEAAHRLKIPANIGVCVGKNVDKNLLRRGVEILFEDKTGIPKFLGIDNVIKGFTKNGYPIELATQRAYSGCHWFGIPGREYMIMDCVKINIAAVFDVALHEMMKDSATSPDIDNLWKYFEKHLHRAVEVIAESLDIHLEHMHEVFPEIVLDLLCYGSIEKGLDASHGGVEYYNMCCDGAGLATVADSFAALEQRIEKEKKLTWNEIIRYIDNNWEGPEGEKVRFMMRSVPHYGNGGRPADEWAVRISKAFSRLVKEKTTPNGFKMIPGLFSWAFHINMGRQLGASPNGRRAGEPISHGANPDPGFAPTALAIAVASVQSSYGNTSPMHIDMDPGIVNTKEGIENVISLIKTHFEMGGTMINMTVLDSKKILEAHKNPLKYPDLIVRVTGFSAYFARLSEDMRQIVVDRIIKVN